ncbi:MAG: hypothetical protein JSV86_05455 [Gemmatimonadota bacterium]|nr:MAG: hypothetical protein JSV86_05455 [Gemmatimonadota bacterium]
MAAIVEWDIDEATYVGDGADGVYYLVDEGPDGWYVTVVVDSETGGFVDTLYEDDGPHPSAAEADRAGRDAAIEWCTWNEVDWA